MTNGRNATEEPSPVSLSEGIGSRRSEHEADRRKRLRVRLGERSYDLILGAGLLADAGDLVAEAVKGRRAMILTHPAIATAHGEAIRASLEKAGFRVDWAIIPPGEKRKSLRQLSDLLRRMLEAGLDRGSTLVALGGGVVGDLGGLAAALFMRGIACVQIPTSLLAMVDSSVGGKTAVDLKDAKNAVGAFYQPSRVLIDTDALGTLPMREVRAGLAEVIKYGILGDAEFFGWIEAHLPGLLALEPDALSHAIYRSCEMKAELVERDEFDRLNLRAALNLGHTVGHALEALGGYRTYRHGEAVAVGMVAAALIAERTGAAEEPVAAPVVSILMKAGLPVRPKAAVDPDALLAAMLKDKKTVEGALNFILPRRIGATTIQSVPARTVLDAMAELGAEGAMR